MICDFGCAQMIVPEGTSVQHSFTGLGAVRYLAPELLPIGSQVTMGDAIQQTKKTDIWAFGMTMFVSRSYMRQ